MQDFLKKMIDLQSKKMIPTNRLRLHERYFVCVSKKSAEAPF